MREFITLIEEASRDQWAYHGTLMGNIESIARYGLQSNLRAKWQSGRENPSAKRFNLLYFSLEGPDEWGSIHGDDDQLAELRFPLSALNGVKWVEDEQRPQRDEYYAVSSKEFAVPPKHIEILRGENWKSLVDYYTSGQYWEDY